MVKTSRQGAAGALLDEYERAIHDLQYSLNDITDEELLTIADSKTNDPNCKSIQTILSHIVRSGYAYAGYVRHLQGNEIDVPGALFHSSVATYREDLNLVFTFTEETFKSVEDNQLEQSDNSKKITTSWGQSYDIEQITEHAIVHILRHRRQIEKFKLLLRDISNTNM